NQPANSERVSFGVPTLDAMCAGGLLRKSVTMVAGPTGTGKSLLGAHFATGDPDERTLVVAFEEGADQLRRNAAGWDLPLERMEAAGNLKIHAVYPESAGLEDHLIRLKKVTAAFQPRRVVIDSLSALERIGSRRGFREFLIALVAHFRDLGITTLMTANTSNLQGGGIASEAQVSSMTDTIILLRYAEQEAHIKRGLAVLKMRGSDQEKALREFTITNNGLAIGEPFTASGGSLLGFVQG
ncbi:MAG: ATPase domain-containing protein, partial [Thiohalorhabdaceae bacterium]